MRSVVAVCLFFLGVFLGAAAMAPWIYYGVRLAAEAVPGLSGLATISFHRYVNRSLIFLGLLGLVGLVRYLRLASWRDLGLGSPRKHARPMLLGFLWGFGSLALVAVLNVAFGNRLFDATAVSFAVFSRIGAVTATAIVVAFVEELLFRGALFGGTRSNLGWQAAMLFSSAIYAIVHFFSSPESPPEVMWYSGFATLGQMLQGFGNIRALVPGFLNLTLAGMILCLAYQRTGSLYFSIGLHAGWIFWLKFYGFLTQGVSGSDSWFWGSRKLIDGWASSIILLAVLLSLARSPAILSPGQKQQSQVREP